MTVHEGILGMMSGGTTRGSPYGDTDVWVDVEFLTIGDQRLKSILLSKYHHELLKTVVGRPVALSLVPAEGATGPGRDDQVVTAVRLPDGSIEKIPRPKPPSYLRAWFDLFRLSVFFFTVGFFANMAHAPVFIIPAVVLELIIVLSFFRNKGRTSRRLSRVNAAADALDGRKFQPAPG